MTEFKLNEETNLYICPECGKEYSKYGIKSHFWRNHTEEGRKFDPNNGFILGTRVAWNKGQTKETDERIRKGAETYRNRVIRGEIKLGHPLSEETKKKLSENKKEYYKEHPELVPYVLYHSSKQSYPEKFFENFLNENKINFSKEFYACGYWLDFCFKEKFYIEIDGEQHYRDQRIVNHDIKRTKELSENGYVLLQRIRWADFQKLNSSDKTKFLKELSEKIKNCC